MSWKNIIKEEVKKSREAQMQAQDKKYKENSKRILDEIKAEGGALDKKHLVNKLQLNLGVLEFYLGRMIREGIIFRHKAGDFYTHDPELKNMDLSSK